MGFTFMRPTRLVAPLVVLAALGGFQRVQADDDPGEKVRAEAEVLGVARAVNQAELDYATAARDRLTDPELTTFCEMLIMDHRAALERVSDVAGRAQITPVESDESRKVLQDARDAIGELGGEQATGKAFDLKFLDGEKDRHGEALETLDGLIESTTHPELSRMLADMRGTIVAHIDRITALKDRLD